MACLWLYYAIAANEADKWDFIIPATLFILIISMLSILETVRVLNLRFQRQMALNEIRMNLYLNFATKRDIFCSMPDESGTPAKSRPIVIPLIYNFGRF